MVSTKHSSSSSVHFVLQEAGQGVSRYSLVDQGHDAQLLKCGHCSSEGERDKGRDGPRMDEGVERGVSGSREKDKRK